jgi:hypothetical protein
MFSSKSTHFHVYRKLQHIKNIPEYTFCPACQFQLMPVFPAGALAALFLILDPILSSWFYFIFTPYHRKAGTAQSV